MPGPELEPPRPSEENSALGAVWAWPAFASWVLCERALHADRLIEEEIRLVRRKFDPYRMLYTQERILYGEIESEWRAQADEHLRQAHGAVRQRLEDLDRQRGRI